MILPEDLLKTNRAPTSAERNSVQGRVNSLSLELKQVQEKIAHLKDTLLGAWLQEKAILEEMAGHQLVLSPFRTLPDDIIREICIACMDPTYPPSVFGSGAERQAPILLLRISRDFRRIALQTPSLWTEMHVEYAPPVSSDLFTGLPLINKISHAASSWARRSGALPLSISLVFHNDGPMIPYPTFLMAPNLTKLDIFFHHVHESTGYFADVITWGANWSNISTLKIQTKGLDRTPLSSPGYLARIMCQTARLVECSLTVGRDLPLSWMSAPKAISLPFLKKLSIDEQPYQENNGFMRYLDAPALEYLNLLSTPQSVSLLPLLKKSPSIKHLRFSLPVELHTLRRYLSHCPLLISLEVANVTDNNGAYTPRHANNAFLNSFVSNIMNMGVCPRLEEFVFFHRIDVSIDVLRSFFWHKNGDDTDLSRWRRVYFMSVECQAPEEATLFRELFAEQIYAGVMETMPVFV